MEVRINRTMPQELLSLYKRCGRRRPNERNLVRSLQGCSFMAGLYEEDELVAFTRVCSDGALNFMVTDFLIDEPFDDRETALLLGRELENYLLMAVTCDGYIYALTDSRYEFVFRTFGYKYMDPDFRTVMVRD